MPVHRPANKRRSAVIAFSEELRGWLMTHREALEQDDGNGSDSSPSKLYEALNRLETESREITARLLQLRQRLKTSMDSPTEALS